MTRKRVYGPRDYNRLLYMALILKSIRSSTAKARFRFLLRRFLDPLNRAEVAMATPMIPQSRRTLERIGGGRLSTDHGCQKGLGAPQKHVR